MIELRVWRKRHGLSQGDLARRIGINVTELSLIEQGRLRPNGRQIERLRDFLGAQTDALLSPVRLTAEADS